MDDVVEREFTAGGNDGCVRMLSVRDPAAEPSGFIFDGTGTAAFYHMQHDQPPDELRDFDSIPIDGRTDDLIKITGFELKELKPHKRWMHRLAPPRQIRARTSRAGSRKRSVTRHSPMVTAESTPNWRRVANSEKATTRKPAEIITEVIAMGRPTRAAQRRTAVSGVAPALRSAR